MKGKHNVQLVYESVFVSGTAAWSQFHLLGMVLFHSEAHKRLAAWAMEGKVRHFALFTKTN